MASSVRRPVGSEIALTLVVASLIAAAGAGAAANDRGAATSASAAPTRVRVVVTANCKTPKARPWRIVFACADLNYLIDHLRWQTWGGRVALGTGSLQYNDCIPYCAAGHFHREAVTIHLYKRRACAGYSGLFYRDATVIRASGRRERDPVFCPSPY
jgi:hypothetical protein